MPACPNCGALLLKNGFRRSLRHGNAQRYRCSRCKAQGLQWTFYGPAEREKIEGNSLRLSVKQKIVDWRFRHWYELPNPVL